jgi:uncharacterized C2H2 Zn-finger protein
MNEKEVSKFTSWLEMSGAQMCPTTNSYEVLRFKTPTGTSVLYKNKGGKLTHTGESLFAYNCFKNNKSCNPAAKVRRPVKNKKQIVADRDGLKCFYCGCVFNDIHQATIEHLLNVSHGGNNHRAI